MQTDIYLQNGPQPAALASRESGWILGPARYHTGPGFCGNIFGSMEVHLNINFASQPLFLTCQQYYSYAYHYTHTPAIMPAVQKGDYILVTGASGFIAASVHPPITFGVLRHPEYR